MFNLFCCGEELGNFFIFVTEAGQDLYFQSISFLSILNKIIYQYSCYDNILIFIPFQDGLYCLSCTNSVSPRHCHTVRKCSEGEVSQEI